LVVPYVFVLVRDPGAFAGVMHYVGERGASAGFDLNLFGAALTVGIALITQMGEQADYLRFMPVRTAANRRRWWWGVLAGGPGWVVLGVFKMLGGALLAYLAIRHMVPAERAVDPNQMYLAAYEYVFPHYGWAVAATALFVVISQLKINVTNAYAGSLAWSNFFSRVTHSHPGRVVWVVFNTLIAFMLMEMNVFQALGEVLGLYSNLAIAWIMAVVADLVINKPLGLSPKGIEFKRAHLYDINPVGVGAMALASALSITAYVGAFGPTAQAFSALIALGTAFVTSPLLAWATQGRYYIARTSHPHARNCVSSLPPEGAAPPWGGPAAERGPVSAAVQRCVICEREYEGPDMAHCPAYQGAICSLCCTLDARCGDLCKPKASLSWQWSSALRWLLPRRIWPYLDTGLGHFLLLMLVVVPLLAAVFGLLYSQETALVEGAVLRLAEEALRAGFLKAYMTLLLIAGIVSWWFVLAHKSRQVAQEESNRQTHLLMREIELHRQTDAELQQARLVAERARQQADQANQAKSRYISAISHELRTPLNSILGYAQLMGEDASVPPHRQHAVQVIRRGGEHLLQLIDGTLDIARIESGKLTLNMKPLAFADTVHEVAAMLELQAQDKGLAFQFEAEGALPEVVRADERRLRQILINLLGNAIKFTATGHVRFRVRYQREMAVMEIEDTGPGITPDALARIFEPFERAAHVATPGPAAPGAGLGLTIAKMLTDLMGGELTASSTPGQGSVFRVRLFLPELHGTAARPVAKPAPAAPRRGYAGARRRILVVDNEEADRELLVHLLAPLGFELRTAASGHDCLDLLVAGLRPDAILMDLAMPGIDGWETIRRLRALLPEPPRVAIVSANAFDKGLENDVGIRPEDFMVKPVRLSELLDWLGRQLAIEWFESPPAAPPLPAPEVAALVYPDPQHLQALQSAIDLGFVRGVANALDTIAREQPECAAFVQTLRGLSRQFQFEAMTQLLNDATRPA
jgi:signal transduction histidine kinase